MNNEHNKDVIRRNKRLIRGSLNMWLKELDSNHGRSEIKNEDYLAQFQLRGIERVNQIMKKF